MDRVIFHFRDAKTDLEAIREYEISEFDEAIKQFHLEFPDESTRPRVFRVEVGHLPEKVV